jgi:hypothetical protein
MGATDVLIWTGDIADPGTVTDHYAGLHDGDPRQHCPRCHR